MEEENHTQIACALHNSQKPHHTMLQLPISQHIQMEHVASIDKKISWDSTELTSYYYQALRKGQRLLIDKTKTNQWLKTRKNEREINPNPMLQIPENRHLHLKRQPCPSHQTGLSMLWGSTMFSSYKVVPLGIGLRHKGCEKRAFFTIWFMTGRPEILEGIQHLSQPCTMQTHSKLISQWCL